MSGEGGPWSCLTASIRTHRCHLHYDNISPRSYQLGNIALHGCQVGWKEGTRSPKDSNLCGCDTRLSVVCPPQMVKNQYEVFVRNKQTNNIKKNVIFFNLFFLLFFHLNINSIFFQTELIIIVQLGGEISAKHLLE